MAKASASLRCDAIDDRLARRHEGLQLLSNAAKTLARLTTICNTSAGRFWSVANTAVVAAENPIRSPR
jgi:hypothetical protein